MIYLLRFLSFRYWWRHRGAFFLATLGVALGLAVFVSIQVANHSVLRAFAASVDAVAGKANLQIEGGHNGLPEEVYTRLRTAPLPGVRASAPLLIKTLHSPQLHRTLLLMGVDLFAEAEFRGWQSDSDSGETPRRAEGLTGMTRLLLDPAAVAISQSLARKYHLREGDPLEVFVGAEQHRFRIAAVLGAGAGDRAFGGDFALLDMATAQEAFHELGHLSQIDLIVDEAQLPATAAALRALVPRDAQVRRPAQRNAQVAGMLAAFQINLSALACISLFVGAFLIYNSIAIAVVRRRAEVAILRSFGTESAAVRRLFLIEAAVIGFLGSVCGMALGLLMARYALQAVSSTVSHLYLTVRAREIIMPLWLWWGGPLGGTLLAVISSIPAAREAAGTPPRVALLGVSLHHATTRGVGRYALLGVAFVGLAAGLCVPRIAELSVYTGFAAAFLTLAGFALLTPLVTLAVGRLVQRIATGTGGITGALAAIYLQRALNRSSLVIAALMVSLAMTIGLAVMVRSFRDTVGLWVDSTINADLFVATATGFAGDPGPGLPPEVVHYVTTLPEVRIYETIRGVDTQLKGRPVFIAANSLPTLATGDRKTRFVETTGGSVEATRRRFLAGDAVLISERFKNLLGYHAGDTVGLATPQGPHDFFVAGVFYDYTPDQCTLFMPQPLFRRYWHDPNLDAVALYLKPGVDLEAVRSAIDRRFGARYQLTLAPNAQIRRTVFSTFDQTFAVTYALQLIAVIVAGIGIFDTLIALLLERNRELAALRALGASRGQVTRLILTEFGLIGVVAWLISIAAGVALAWELIYVINRQFFGWTIFWSLPLAVPAQALLLALATALLAGLLPARAAGRRSLASALQME